MSKVKNKNRGKNNTIAARSQTSQKRKLNKTSFESRVENFVSGDYTERELYTWVCECVKLMRDTNVKTAGNGVGRATVFSEYGVFEFYGNDVIKRANSLSEEARNNVGEYAGHIVSKFNNGVPFSEICEPIFFAVQTGTDYLDAGVFREMVAFIAKSVSWSKLSTPVFSFN